MRSRLWTSTWLRVPCPVACEPYWNWEKKALKRSGEFLRSLLVAPFCRDEIFIFALLFHPRNVRRCFVSVLTILNTPLRQVQNFQRSLWYSRRFRQASLVQGTILSALRMARPWTTRSNWSLSLEG